MAAPQPQPPVIAAQPMMSPQLSAPQFSAGLFPVPQQFGGSPGAGGMLSGSPPDKATMANQLSQWGYADTSPSAILPNSLRSNPNAGPGMPQFTMPIPNVQGQIADMPWLTIRNVNGPGGPNPNAQNPLTSEFGGQQQIGKGTWFSPWLASPLVANYQPKFWFGGRGPQNNTINTQPGGGFTTVAADFPTNQTSFPVTTNTTPGFVPGTPISPQATTQMPTMASAPPPQIA